jgi:hypothetical protein
MTYIVNGKVLTEEQFKKLQNDPNIKLILIENASNTYKTLQKLLG